MKRDYKYKLEPRAKVVSVKFRPSEIEALDKVGHARCMNRSEIVRKCVLKYIKSVVDYEDLRG